MSTTMQFRLLDLPNELIIRVVELVESVATLSHMACTCRRIQELVEPVLYRELLVKDATHASVLQGSFKGRQQRALAVQILEVPANPTLVWHREMVGALLREVLGVKELMIESPLVNSFNFEPEEWWTLMMNHLFQPFTAALIRSKPSTRPLQKLTSCKYKFILEQLLHGSLSNVLSMALTYACSNLASERTGITVLGLRLAKHMHLPTPYTAEDPRFLHELGRGCLRTGGRPLLHSFETSCTRGMQHHCLWP